MKKRMIASLLALPLAVPAAWAQDSNTVRVSGFGTGALTWADTDDAQFARFGQASGAGKSPRTGVDSNLGLQADYRVNDWLSFTAQGLVSKEGADDYGAELGWAFAKVKLSDQWSVRVGRVGLPVFMISDSRFVGYANTMLRPAQEVYNQIPVSHLDGGDVTWQQSYGDTTVSVSFSVGRNKTDLGTITSEHALNLVVEHGPLTLRVGQVDGKLALTIPVALPGGQTTKVTLPAQGLVRFGRRHARLEKHRVAGRDREDAQHRRHFALVVRDGRVSLRQGAAVLQPWLHHRCLPAEHEQPRPPLGRVPLGRHQVPDRPRRPAEQGLFHERQAGLPRPGYCRRHRHRFRVLRKFVMTKNSKALMAAILLAACAPALAEVVVIVNPKAAESTMSRDQVAQLFLGKSTAMTPVDQPESAAIRTEFYKKVTDKEPSQVKALWSKLVFTGKATMPKEAADSTAVKKAVAADPKAIGYIEKSALDPSVKAVFTAP